MIRPQSSTAIIRCSSTSPVSRSISTTAMCVPKGQVKFVGSKVAVASRPGSISWGSLSTCR